jgi:hypothetical protein
MTLVQEDPITGEWRVGSDLVRYPSTFQIVDMALSPSGSLVWSMWNQGVSTAIFLRSNLEQKPLVANLSELLRASTP